MVARTSKVSEANMSLENVTFEKTIKVILPAAKKRKRWSHTWEPSEMPQVPILVNKSKIEKDMKLLMFLPGKKKEQ